MVDLVVRGATVVDGTGAPARQADVAVECGQVRAGWRCVAAATLDSGSPHVVGVILRQNRIPTASVVRPIRELAAALDVGTKPSVTR